MAGDDPETSAVHVCGPTPPPPRFPDRLRLPLVFDPGLLTRDLEAASSGAWTRHVARQNYDGDWSVIPLRGKAGALRADCDGDRLRAKAGHRSAALLSAAHACDLG